jgi:hypothetical protein
LQTGRGRDAEEIGKFHGLGTVLLALIFFFFLFQDIVSAAPTTRPPAPHNHGVRQPSRKHVPVNNEPLQDEGQVGGDGLVVSHEQNRSTVGSVSVEGNGAQTGNHGT